MFDILKEPLASVTAPFVVPTISTEAPVSFSELSATMPVTAPRPDVWACIRVKREANKMTERVKIFFKETVYFKSSKST